jgi:hypothetical protein
MAKSSDPIESELSAIDQEEQGPPAKSMMRFAPAAGAVIALAAFAGITWYAYNTGIREGSEFAAPVLKPDGPNKIAPESPGGENVPHRKKQVYSLVDKSQTSNKVERIAPAPEQPMAIPQKPFSPPPVSTPALNPPPAPPTVMNPPPPSITGKREVASAPKPPSPAKQTQTEGTPPVQKVLAAPVVKASPKPVAKTAKPVSPPSPPVSKPANLPKAATIATTKSAPAKPAAVNSPPSGVYLVQIASLRTAESARRAWDQYNKKHKPLFNGLKFFVARKSIPGRGDFFRVQTGPFETRAAAARKCAEFKKNKIPCLVIRP